MRFSAMTCIGARLPAGDRRQQLDLIGANSFNRSMVTCGIGAGQGEPLSARRNKRRKKTAQRNGRGMGQPEAQAPDERPSATRETLADLAARFVRARADSAALPDDPSALLATVADAYAVQSNIIALTGDVRGWKVTGWTPADQAKYRSDRPVAGPLLAPFLVPSPAAFALSQFVAPLIECEVAFVLGADLPPREIPYERAEIEAAIETVVAGVEIVDSRIPAGATDLLRLADSMANGAYVTGAPAPDWRGLDLAGIPVAFNADNGDKESGLSTRVLGNPLLAVIALANAQPLAGPGLKKGHVITTGTCTPPVPLRRGAYVADFGPLGQVRLSVG
jgi:2-keto-4-pentenoate hydratase